jgi:hypothetical protein
MLLHRRCTTSQEHHQLERLTQVQCQVTWHLRVQACLPIPTTLELCQVRCQVRCQVSTQACQVSHHSSCRQVTPTLPLPQQHSKQLQHKPPLRLLLLQPRLQLRAVQEWTSLLRLLSMMRQAQRALR